MKKILILAAVVFLSANAFGQIVDSVLQNQSNLMVSLRAPLKMQPVTPNHTSLYSGSKQYINSSTHSDATILKNVVWSGVTGTVLGLSLVLTESNNGYRPKPREAIMFSTIGAGAGIVVGLISGIVSKSRQRK